MIGQKRRTKEHVTADLGVNFVERQILLCGHTPERVVHDYGYDLMLFSFDGHGHPEVGQIYVQVRATSQIIDSVGPVTRIERSHLVQWLAQRLPVIVVLYDRSRNQGYWAHVQHHFNEQTGFNLFAAGRTITLRFDEGALFDYNAVNWIVAEKNLYMKEYRPRGSR